MVKKKRDIKPQMNTDEHRKRTKDINHKGHKVNKVHSLIFFEVFVVKKESALISSISG